MPAVFITGVNRGLGKELARHYLEKGFSVLGTSRNHPGIEHPNFQFCPADLGAGSVPAPLIDCLAAYEPIDLVFLNAGVLGNIKRLEECTGREIRDVMNVNVWANKALLDTLLQSQTPPGQVIGISSGAAVNGSAGWGPYSISKTALNLLLRVSAHENPGCHMCALAPGLVGTDMLDTILDSAPRPEFDADTRLREASDAGKIQTPAEAARNIAAIVDQLQTVPSGAFVDIRNLPF